MSDLKSFIKQGVESKVRQESEKEHYKELSKDAKEVFGISIREFNAKVNAAYDLYEAAKKRDELNEIISELQGMGF